MSRDSSPRRLSTLHILLILLGACAVVSVTYLGWTTHSQTSTGADNRLSMAMQAPPSLILANEEKEQTVSTADEQSGHFLRKNNALSATENEEILQSRYPAETEIKPVKTDPPMNVYLSRATRHSILSLSDEELRDTPLDELMAHYGEARGGGSCGDDFGNALVRRWREQRKNNCAAKDLGENALHSTVDCFLVSQTRHHGNGDNLCLMENVAVDLRAFGDERFTLPVIEEYVNTRHMKQPYPPFPRGFVKADCEPVPDQWQHRLMPGWNADLTVNALLPLAGEEAERGKELCSVWIDHPVLFQQRDTFANFFHDSEDFVNVFLAFAILQWKPRDAQVMLTDLYPEGPFWDMWKRVFSHGHDAMTAWDIKEKYGHEKGHVCFKQLAVGIYGPAAPITIHTWDTPCTHTALVRAYSDFVIRSLNLQSLTHYAQPAASKTITVTYMSRRASKQWPEHKYCDDNHSFFLCRFWEHFGPRSLGRMVRNDDEVVRALQSLEQESFDGGKTVKVQAVDYNVLSFEEQIKVDLQTDIMVGPHGAGLMHNIFMRDRAHLVELFVDGSSSNRHFHNLAHWYGRPYRGESMNNPINTRQLLQIVREAVRAIDPESY